MRLSPVLLILSLLPAMPAVEVTAVHLAGLLQPQAVLGADGILRVVGVTAGNDGSDVIYRQRGADGVFSAPRVVNDQPKAATCIGSIRGARLALGRDGIAHIAWNAQDGRGFWYSRDFAPARNLLGANDAVDGGGAITADGTGRLAIVFHHQGGGTGEAGRQVSAVTSDDDGVTLSPTRRLAVPAVGVCGCCSLAAGLDAGGRIELLVRNADDGARDMWWIPGDGQGRKVGPWQVRTCPMSTAAIAHGGSATGIAWEQQGQVWWSRDGKQPVTVGPGKYPALAIDSAGTVVLAWATGTAWNRGGDVHWQAYDAAGAALGAPGVQRGMPAWDTPSVVAEGAGRFTVLW